MHTPHSKPKSFKPEQILVDGKPVTKLAKKAKVDNRVVALFRAKGRKLTKEDLKELEK